MWNVIPPEVSNTLNIYDMREGDVAFILEVIFPVKLLSELKARSISSWCHVTSFKTLPQHHLTSIPILETIYWNVIVSLRDNTN